MPSRAEPRRAVPSRAEPRRAMPSRAEPCRAVPSRAESCRAVLNRADLSAEAVGRLTHCQSLSRAEPSRDRLSSLSAEAYRAPRKLL